MKITWRFATAFRRMAGSRSAWNRCGQVGSNVPGELLHGSMYLDAHLIARACRSNLDSIQIKSGRQHAEFTRQRQRLEHTQAMAGEAMRVILPGVPVKTPYPAWLVAALHGVDEDDPISVLQQGNQMGARPIQFF